METANKSVFIWAAVMVLLLGGAAYPLWKYLSSKEAPITTSGPTASSTFTPRVTVSPDGNRAVIETALNKAVNVFEVELVAREVLEDSRCPKDVSCIQAGTVRVDARVKTGFGEKNVVFTLEKPEVVDNFAIELKAVLPLHRSSLRILPSDYRFTFSVTRLTGTFDVKG